MMDGKNKRVHLITSSGPLDTISGSLNSLLANNNNQTMTTTSASITSSSGTSPLIVKGLVKIKELGSTNVATQGSERSSNIISTIAAGRAYDMIKLEFANNNNNNLLQKIYGTVDSMACSNNSGGKVPLIEYVSYGWISFPMKSEIQSEALSSCMSLLK